MAKVALTASRVLHFKCPPDKAQAFLWDANSPGLGVRATPSGKPAYIFQSEYQGKSVRLTIGSPDAWSIPQAQTKVREFQRMIDGGQDPREQKRVAIAAVVAQQTKQVELEQFTLKHLLAHYCDYLAQLGRTAHREARSTFKLHVNEAWPKVAALPANQVTYEHIADMMRRLLELGKGRSSNKLRSYVRAAYQVAKASRSKASIPLIFKGFNITHNPAADTEPDESQNKADKNPLNLHDLRKYWQAIQQIDGFKGALLRLHLLTGGQRIEQLVRIRTADCAGDSILLFDGKGRPGKPARPHTVPLVDEAVVALIECAPQGEFALSTDNGDTHVVSSSLSRWAVDAAADIEGFRTKRIRSGVETLLASARVSGEHRGRLQSHGISGVQSRHYDGHDYMDEKRNALETLFRLLDQPEVSNVIPIGHTA